MNRMSFDGLAIEHDDRVLQPRPWTVAQSRWAAELAPRAEPDVLELFAGVGHIGLAAAVAASAGRLVLVDLDPVACAWARRNATSAGLGPVVDVREGRVDEALEAHERFDLILADPPWVPTADVGDFPDDPTLAIDGGHDGLDLARAVCAVIEQHLAADGSAILQVGTSDQVDSIAEHLVATGGGLRVLETRVLAGGALARLAWV